MCSKIFTTFKCSHQSSMTASAPNANGPAVDPSLAAVRLVPPFHISRSLAGIPKVTPVASSSSLQSASGNCRGPILRLGVRGSGSKSHDTKKPVDVAEMDDRNQFECFGVSRQRETWMGSGTVSTGSAPAGRDNLFDNLVKLSDVSEHLETWEGHRGFGTSDLPVIATEQHFRWRQGEQKTPGEAVDTTRALQSRHVIRRCGEDFLQQASREACSRRIQRRETEMYRPSVSLQVLRRFQPRKMSRRLGGLHHPRMARMSRMLFATTTVGCCYTPAARCCPATVVWDFRLHLASSEGCSGCTMASPNGALQTGERMNKCYGDGTGASFWNAVSKAQVTPIHVLTFSQPRWGSQPTASKRNREGGKIPPLDWNRRPGKQFLKSGLAFTTINAITITITITTAATTIIIIIITRHGHRSRTSR
ncbi:hypothetical protein SODALDRAFT_358412 [Sodiomyces alkalinus F11]|uniref:Uncharacterized protein n=1 Tax=Sodiomyces alkalinus (strain CBS 110278 / VKM F-3762 / F11) TaxID=1314773 RepID=A0A3N2Q059_SODAK|nr:hypothetical protein SODALDRAFT_358412 [Sodiomyces alkalinus F11]ROT39995.1 hypothetical protein SODALDRAFT_358412 [Sodiomyces alkalinus F11]